MIECKWCKAPVNEGDYYCSKCGGKVFVPQESPKMPKMLTVKEAIDIFFKGCIGKTFLYTAIKEHRLPHVKMSGGKILLDVDELGKWWQEELKKSTEVPAARGLRKII